MSSTNSDEATLQARASARLGPLNAYLPGTSDEDSTHSERARNRIPTYSPAIAVATARYVLLHLAEALTGYTVKAMEKKIETGVWLEGKEWRRAPDGRILLDVLGYQKWVEGR